MPTATPAPVRRRTVHAAGLAVWIGAALFFAVYGYLTVRQFRRFQVTAFDFAIFDQGLWLLGNLEPPFATVRDCISLPTIPPTCSSRWRSSTASGRGPRH